MKRSAILLLLACAALGPAAHAADRPAEVTNREGRVVRTIRPGGAPRDAAPVRSSTATRATAVVPTADLGRPGRPEGTAPDSWPMYQVDARHTGYVPVTLDASLFAFRWEKNVGNTLSLNPVTAANGKVFVSLRVYFNNVPQLFALRSIDGQTLWSKSFGEVFSVNPPSYAYGRVYVQTGDHADDTFLHAYDADTGSEVFTTPHAAQWERYLAPTIDNGVVYVDGGSYGGMYAFDAGSGQQLWFTGLPQYDQWTPAVAGNVAYSYLGEYAPGLYGLDRATGVQVLYIPDPDFDWNGWSMDLAPVVGTMNDVLAIHDGRLISFDPTLGTIRWQVQGQFAGQLSLAHDLIYAVSGNRVSVLQEATHAEVWWWQPPAGTPAGPVLVTDSHFFVSTADAVYAVDLTTGQTAWTYPRGGALTLADNTLFIASLDGRLTAISLPHLTPAALAVADPGNTANGLLEPGETAQIRPSWRAGLLGATAVTGTATSRGGFSVLDGAAIYGTVNAHTTAGCAGSNDCYAITVDAARPTPHWDVTLAEALSTGDRKDWLLHVGGSFGDVPATSSFYPFVETILHNGITGGCANASYCPTTPTTREQMAVFALESKEGSGYAPPACGGTPMFPDVPIPSPYCRWIEELARRGVVNGCGNGLYCPTAAVARDAMAVIVLRTLDPALMPPACGTPVFNDVPASSAYCRWIEELVRRGVVSGCGGGDYCPTAAVTREQMSVFLSLTFGLTLYGP